MITSNGLQRKFLHMRIFLVSLLYLCLAAAVSPNQSGAAETLTEAWSEALAVDQALEASQWTSSAAQRRLYAARAARWASLDGVATYQVFDKPLAVLVPLPSGGTTSFDLTQREGVIAGVHATQPLYAGGAIRSNIDAAGAVVNVALSKEETTELDVMLGVATTYTNVLNALRALEVAEQAVTSLEGHTRDVRNRVDQGVGIRNNLLASEVALANARQQKLQVVALVDVTKAAYNRALQRPLDTAVDLVDLTEPQGEFSLAYLSEQALNQRPEISTLNASVQALRSQGSAVRAGNKPQFNIRGGFDFIENRFFENEAFASIAVVGEWKFFDAGGIRQKATALEQEAEALVRQRNDVETKILLQVRDTWQQLQTTRERVVVNRNTLASAEENLKVAKNRYIQGAGTNTEVLDAETLRTQTYSNYYQSVYNSVRALMGLSRAVGDFDLARSEVTALQQPAELIQ